MNINNPPPWLQQLSNAVPGLKLTPKQESAAHAFLMRFWLEAHHKGELHAISCISRDIDAFGSRVSQNLNCLRGNQS